MDAFTDLGCKFNSTALDGKKVRVLAVEGEERLGELYEFRVRFRYDGGRLSQGDLDQLLLAPCVLLFDGDADAVHGIARSVETLDEQRTHQGTGSGVYDVVLVPTMWLLTISKVSRLYQEMSVKDIAADVLGRYKLTGSHYDLRVTGSPRELVIQYHESDWDFLQRWFEHEGYFYWFEHSTSGEKLIVADANSEATLITGDSFVPYREVTGLERQTQTVFEWRCVQSRIPARVFLRDYNYQKPALAVVGQADIDKKLGFGTFYEYGDNFDTPDAGNALAKVRAQRFLAAQRTYHGVTDCTRFHVGHSFDLSDHPDDTQNGEYLITAMKTRVGKVPAAGGDREVLGYRASFEAIPLKVQYRPERRTEWPSIHGVIHAHIDSDSAGKYSTLDPQGRYRVRFPFDGTGKSGEKSSTWVRLMQPYSGSGYGSHHPLHKGTEVILAFLDGDPDRPVILGTVPNAQTPGVSAAANATQSGTRTASGIHLTMDDSLSKS